MVMDMITKEKILEAYHILKKERDIYLKLIFELKEDFDKRKFDNFYYSMPDANFEYYDEELSKESKILL